MDWEVVDGLMRHLTSSLGEWCRRNHFMYGSGIRDSHWFILKQQGKELARQLRPKRLNCKEHMAIDATLASER